MVPRQDERTYESNEAEVANSMSFAVVANGLATSVMSSQSGFRGNTRAVVELRYRSFRGNMHHHLFGYT